LFLVLIPSFLLFLPQCVKFFKRVYELIGRHEHVVEVIALSDEKELKYAHYELVALFHNIINIASIGIRLTDRWEEFTEDELSEIGTLIEVLECYTQKAKDYLHVLEERRDDCSM